MDDQRLSCSERHDVVQHEHELDKVAFQSIGELPPLAGGGWQLNRVPAAVRAALSERGQAEMACPAGAEIRFVSDSDTVRVTLSAPQRPTFFCVAHGPFLTRHRIEVTARPQAFELTRPPMMRVVGGDVPAARFDPRVWRLSLMGNEGPVVFHGIGGDGVRPPPRAMLPARRYLAYGTSITAGSAATAPHLTWAQQVAWRLGADLIALGSGGSAYCEPAMARYIASRDDWHFATLELSVNMEARLLDEFSRIVTEFVHTIANAHPHKPVFCVTHWTTRRDFASTRGGLVMDVPSEAYREALRRAAQTAESKNIHVAEGSALLSPTNHSDDLLHPSDLGMIEIAEKLAAIMLPHLPPSPRMGAANGE